MSDFESLVRIAQNQSRTSVEDRVEEIVDPQPIDPELLEQEKLREQNPRYLAEKERIRIMEMDKSDSPFQHPCQNEKNTVTLVSIDKCHEIDIEFNREAKTAMVNLIKIEPDKRDTLIQLLHSINSYLREETIEKVYQYVVISDWETSMSNVSEFRHVRTVVSNDSPMPFVIVECDTQDLTNGIIRALGMDIHSHLDPEDLDKIV